MKNKRLLPLSLLALLSLVSCANPQPSSSSSSSEEEITSEKADPAKEESPPANPLLRKRFPRKPMALPVKTKPPKVKPAPRNRAALPALPNLLPSKPAKKKPSKPLFWMRATEKSAGTAMGRAKTIRPPCPMDPLSPSPIKMGWPNPLITGNSKRVRASSEIPTPSRA